MQSETGHSDIAHLQIAEHSNIQSYTKELGGGKDGREWFELLKRRKNNITNDTSGDIGHVRMCNIPILFVCSTE